MSLAEDYSLIFSGEAGRRVLADLEHEGCTRRHMVVGGDDIDPVRLGYLTGMHDMVARIFYMLDLAARPKRSGEIVQAISSTVEG